jgi:hypothetical protein
MMPCGLFDSPPDSTCSSCCQSLDAELLRRLPLLLPLTPVLPPPLLLPLTPVLLPPLLLLLLPLLPLVLLSQMVWCDSTCLASTSSSSSTLLALGARQSSDTCSRGSNVGRCRKGED